MSLKQIKSKIISTKKTGQVTKAMEAVSAVKMRKSQERMFESRPYVHAAMRIVSRVARSQELLRHPLLQKRKGSKKLLILVTSDKGLAGSVNSAVLKKIDDFLADNKNSAAATLCIGKKAVEFAKRRNLEILGEFTNVGDDVQLSDMYTMVDIVLKEYEDAEYDQVVIGYQNFLSTFEQEPTLRTVLPLDPNEVHFIMRGIRPKTGKFSEIHALRDERRIVYTVEPSSAEVLRTFVPQLVEIIVFHALTENKASEHSARMVAMKNATDKSNEIAKELTLVYNKERQAVITAEVSEITGGIEAMKQA